MALRAALRWDPPDDAEIERVLRLTAEPPPLFDEIERMPSLLQASPPS